MTTKYRLAGAIVFAAILAPLQMTQAQLPHIQAPVFRVETTLVSDAATLAPARCDTGLHNAQVDISTTLHPGAGQLTGGAPLVDVLVDGVSQGIQPATSRLINPINPRGGALVDVRRTIALPGPGGSHTLQFVLNRTYRSNVQTITFSCLQAVQPMQQASRTFWKPDIGIDTSIIGAFYEPPQPIDICHPQGLSQCPAATSNYDYSYGELPGRTRFFPNPLSLSVIDLSGMVGCPPTGDAIKTVDFVIAITTDRFDYGSSRVALTHENHWYYTGDPQELVQTESTAYFDARATTRAADPGTMSYPVGHQWLWFERQLPCTSDGIFTFTLDPDGVLDEANETNNTIRFHYRTR